MKFECESKAAEKIMQQKLIQIKNIYAESETFEPEMYVHNFNSLKAVIKYKLNYYKNKKITPKGFSTLWKSSFQLAGLMRLIEKNRR